MMGFGRKPASDGLHHRVRPWRLPDHGPAPTSDGMIHIAPTQVALLGQDFPGTRLDPVVEEGDQVAAGAVVLRDRKHPEIAFTAPAGGHVARIRRGARRALQALEIQLSDHQDTTSIRLPDNPDAGAIRAAMLESGLWSCLRTRPFGHLPLPQAKPVALFVNAMDTRPLAPDPMMVINLHQDWFEAGLKALAIMVPAPVYVCAAAGASPPVPEDGDLRLATFDGPHPAGLSGIHIQALCPVGGGSREVWQIDHVDVLSLGRLMREGVPWTERVISVAGPGFSRPALVTTVQGAAHTGIVEACGFREDSHLLAGSPIDGVPINRYHGFLGQRQRQLTALRPVSVPSDMVSASAWPLIPTTDLDAHAPPGVLAAPLLRALLVGDTDRARKLGALELLEEDLAGITAICSAGTDFGRLLRRSLERIYRDEA